MRSSCVNRLPSINVRTRAPRCLVYHARYAYCPRVEFEWDPAKNAATYQARGFDFAYASRIFAADCIESADTRTNYGEARIKATGQVGSDVLTVIYTRRGTAIR